MGRRLALLIATYQYQDTGLRRLTAPAHDAELLAAVLGDPDIAGFEVTTLINEPHHRVGAAIGDFYRDRRRDDLTLLYFTGHGVKDDDGRLYLAMADTRRDSLLFTALSAEQIDHAMSGCPSRRQVLILDCCYSGAFPAGRLAKADTDVHALERFHGRGRTVLTASDAPSTPSRATSYTARPPKRCSPATSSRACATAVLTSTATETSLSMNCTATSTTGSSRRCPSSGRRNRTTSKAAPPSPETSTGPCPHTCTTQSAARSPPTGSAPSTG
ncbi:MAG: caspase, EACC1-associated type [Pseudonocardiaceae bacterium]